MPTVVTDNCRGCRYTECVTACPVACFHGDDEMVYINQDVCIDCRACIPMCPVDAIFDVDDLPTDKQVWIKINTDRAPVLPRLPDKQSPLPGADARRAALGL